MNYILCTTLPCIVHQPYVLFSANFKQIELITLQQIVVLTSLITSLALSTVLNIFFIAEIICTILMICQLSCSLDILEKSVQKMYTSMELDISMADKNGGLPVAHRMTLVL